MNGELLAIVDSLEREKGIEKEVLLQAIEAAILSAARKGSENEKEITVEIDRSSGEIKVMVEGAPLPTDAFGRIAAQAAKQVVTQKIREAEKEVIYNEYKERTGNLISGLVHRFHGKDIIIDLGKTEGILPYREQSRREEYRQGDRVRAYLLDVKKAPRGPEIILSRTHPELVRKLFEIEVPEIHERIVEIKSVSRDPGERTKIAVWSNDEKVDAVGACVGVKGQRVKNIVHELSGEKIDIVRWSMDIGEYIKAALSPAEVLDIQLTERKKTALVIVDDDQLPLAIGKGGQNVRLASKLMKWRIDVRKISQLREKKKLTLTDMEGAGPKTAVSLVEAGFKTIEDVAKASLEDLVKVPGIGKKKAETIYKSAVELSKV